MHFDQFSTQKKQHQLLDIAIHNMIDIFQEQQDALSLSLHRWRTDLDSVFLQVQPGSQQLQGQPVRQADMVQEVCWRGVVQLSAIQDLHGERSER